MNERYRIENSNEIISPSLIVFLEYVEQNIDEMIRMAGDVRRLRPHCKTHKLEEITRMELKKGIEKYKCATFAEAEMLARAGVKDIFLAYNLVGPNISRAVRFLKQFPDVSFLANADHPLPVKALGKAMTEAGTEMELLLDLDVGQHRTGVEMNENAVELYKTITETPGVEPGGFHVYDGHQKQVSLDERIAAIKPVFERVLIFGDEIVSHNWPVPRIVCGGTGSFPVYARETDPSIELSPGTVVFHDAGYSQNFPDLKFTPAAVILTRVVSRPTPNRITLDAGSKAVASDPPMKTRLVFPDLPDAKIVLHNEEHLVVETAQAENYTPGDNLIGIPWHICPTTALHKQVFVVKGDCVIDQWVVIARDRMLTI